MKELVVHQGFMKFWREGEVKFVQQVGNSDSPEKYGIYCFPYPFFEPYFTSHREEKALPLRFKNYINVVTSNNYRNKSKNKHIVNELRNLVSQDLQSYDLMVLNDFPYHCNMAYHVVTGEKYPDKTYPIFKDFDNFYSFAQEWIFSPTHYQEILDYYKKNNSRIKKRFEFYYSGMVYSRVLNPKLPDSHNGWFAHHTSDVVKNLHVAGLDWVTGYNENTFTSYQISSDHLEIFIPRSQGKFKNMK